MSDVVETMRAPTHPGTLLKEDVLPALGMTQEIFAELIGLSRKTVNEILAGKSPVRATTAIELGKLLGNSPQFWMNLQSSYDLWEAANRADQARPGRKAAAKKVAVGKLVGPRTSDTPRVKAMTPSPALAAVIGAMAVPRTEVTSKLWAYIKKNKLQEPTAKRLINTDPKLQEVFGKTRVDMVEMTQLVQGHLK